MLFKEKMVDEMRMSDGRSDVCLSIIADMKNIDKNSKSTINSPSSLNTQNDFISIQSLVGMPAYDWDAMLIGNVQEIGLKRTSKGKMEINLKIPKKSNNQNVEVAWKNISKIGDIILLENSESSEPSQLGKCSYCSYYRSEERREGKECVSQCRYRW